MIAQPGSSDLWFLPLGGCGEIGMNLNLYGHAGQWLMVDCGITFLREGDPQPTEHWLEQEGRINRGFRGNPVVLPDPEFISQRRKQLVGLVVTHAHEDHCGAIPRLWPQLRCPIYTTAFTAAVLRRKLAEGGLQDEVPLNLLKPGDAIDIGAFSLEWIELTHSIPEPQSLLIRTPAGSIFHTGDWKLDADPVLPSNFQADRLRALAGQSVRAVVCDSTNALSPGHSTSEGALRKDLMRLVRSAPGRVIAACFGSNVARLITLCRIARECGREVGLLGRSLQNMLQAARSTGYWPSDLPVIDSQMLGYLPADKVMVIATGSQGEPRTALYRLARRDHRDLDLDPGDRVLFSSRVIPGNEPAVQKLITLLKDGDIEVIESSADDLIHASGHPCQEELRQLYTWVRPEIAVPVHGEAEHMAANAAIARQAGVPRQLTGRNGDLFLLGRAPGVRRKAVRTGRLLAQ